VYYMNPGVPTQKGRSAIRNYFTSYTIWFSDWTHVERSRLIQGNRAVCIIEFDDQGLAKETRVYIDVQLIADQLK
jgi:hypothetical protein